MQPQNAVARLKVVVGHIGDTWVHAIHRQEYFHSMTRNEELAQALRDTYAAHVHNAVTDMFVMDLIREIGAIVLDQNPNSASVAVANQLLSDAAVVDELKKDCQITIPAQWINPSSGLDEKMRQTVTEDLRRQDIEDNVKAFEGQLADLPQIMQPVLDSDIGRMIRKARNKSVAHYDVVRTGGDWKLWQIEGITFGDLDRYFDTCTAGVEALARLVRGQAFQFPETRNVARDYASDYIDALVEGLRSKRNKTLTAGRSHSQQI